jgi:uncharacterized protein
LTRSWASVVADLPTLNITPRGNHLGPLKNPPARTARSNMTPNIILILLKVQAPALITGRMLVANLRGAADIRGVVCPVIHAGDVGNPAVLDRLRLIAPVVAVRGNVDTAPWAQNLSETEVVVLGPSIYVLHDRSQLPVDPVGAGYAAVVFGHKRRWLRPAMVSYLNPGSAGPRRFRLPITMARLQVSATLLAPEIVRLPID